MCVRVRVCVCVCLGEGLSVAVVMLCFWGKPVLMHCVVSLTGMLRGTYVTLWCCLHARLHARHRTDDTKNVELTEALAAYAALGEDSPVALYKAAGEEEASGVLSDPNVRLQHSVVVIQVRGSLVVGLALACVVLFLGLRCLFGWLALAHGCSGWVLVALWTMCAWCDGRQTRVQKAAAAEFANNGIVMMFHEKSGTSHFVVALTLDDHHQLVPIAYVVTSATQRASVQVCPACLVEQFASGASHASHLRFVWHEPWRRSCATT